MLDSEGRKNIVVSQNAWACQRSVRWDDYIMIRTYDTGLKEFPEYMLFNVKEDPHELNDLAESKKDVLYHGVALLEQWVAREMTKTRQGVDPMWTVMSEGGSFHSRDELKPHTDFLRKQGLNDIADRAEMQGTTPVRIELL